MREDALRAYNDVPVRLILASNSPRRQELLRNAGFDFEVRSCQIPEDLPHRDEIPADFARRIARAKALCVAGASAPGNLVLGADTVVLINGKLLGKPTGRHEATRMLRLLSGHTHQVITGVCLVRAPDQIEALSHETTFVTFRVLDDQEIRAYVESREPFDKAGGYAIQGLASRFVTRIAGCYFNVVGLPIPLLYEMLKRLEANEVSSLG